MKKIIITFLALYLSIISAFAETSIDFYSEKNTYDIEEPIKINIEVSSDKDDGLELKINGLDNFQIVGQNKSQSTQIINNSKTTSFKLLLTVLAKQAGDFIIGPIIIDSPEGEIKSKTISINITGERIMVNSMINANKIDSDDTEEEQNIDDIDLSTSGIEKKDIEIIPKKIIGIDGEEMLDIYKQKDFLYGTLFSKISLYFLLISLVLFIIYIIIEKYYKEYLRKQELLKQINKPIIKKRINYKRLFKILEDKFLNEKKEIFYSKTSEVFRIFLDDKIENGLSKKSFQEIKTCKKVDSKLINIYEKIYFPEYNTKNDNIEERKEILEEIKNIVINKK